MAYIYAEPAKIKSTGRIYEEISKTVREIGVEVGNTRNGLKVGSAETTREFVKQLTRIETVITQFSVSLRNLGGSLDYIAETYVKYENRISGMIQGENLRSFITRYIEESFLDFLRILGLDDDYYRHRTGYEYYDPEEAQEELMDHFLSDACADLTEEERFSRETWEKASVQERKEILRDFMLEINALLGTNVEQEIQFVSLDRNTRGQYNSATNSITINSNYLSRSDSYQIMQTLIHEMRHCYQHTAVEHPEEFMVTEETLEQWENNFQDGNYKTVERDGYDSYVEQPIEWDAKNFAKQDQDVEGKNPEYGGSWD